MDKKVVVILVIIALVLATISIIQSLVNPIKEVSLVKNPTIIKSSGQSQMGVEILPTTVEEKYGQE